MALSRATANNVRRSRELSRSSPNKRSCTFASWTYLGDYCLLVTITPRTAARKDDAQYQIHTHTDCVANRPNADSGVAGFPLRHWSMKVVLVHAETKKDVNPNIFESITFHLHESFGDKAVQSMTFKPMNLLWRSDKRCSIEEASIPNRWRWLGWVWA